MLADSLALLTSLFKCHLPWLPLAPVTPQPRLVSVTRAFSLPYALLASATTIFLSLQCPLMSQVTCASTVCGGVSAGPLAPIPFGPLEAPPPHSSCSLNPGGSGEPRSMFLAKQRHCNVGHCLNCRVPCSLEVSGGHSQILGAGPRRGLQGIKSLT